MEQTLSADAHGTVGILPLEGILSREEVARTPRFVLVDGSNLYHALKGEGRRIDYRELRERLSEGEESLPLYFSYAPSPRASAKHRSFLRAIQGAGWRVVEAASSSGGYRKEKGLDVALALTLVYLASPGRTLVLVSGDGDFVPAVRAARSQGAEVVVASPLTAFSSQLAREADRVLLI